MSLPIEDYAMVGDRQTAALIGKNGSVDWLCFPRFDSGACFAALLGDERHGRWLIAPIAPVTAVRRRYRPGTLVLETEMDTADGTIRIIDCMPARGEAPDLVRIVEGVRGRVAVHVELIIRTDYGSIVPWVRQLGDGSGIIAVAGPDALVLHTPVHLTGANLRHAADFTVPAGERVPFVLTWCPSHRPVPRQIDAEHAVADTTGLWEDWSQRSTYQGPWAEPVMRSLITLKALTYEPTGGIVAAPTTSLPEQLGGVRNWDYRFCWIRDASFTLTALVEAGYMSEAQAWRDWLLRAVAGSPERLQIMYGPAGERRLPEQEIPWLPGYEKSAPVRIGNAAAGQFQLDVWGELMDAMHQARLSGIASDGASWSLLKALLDYLEGHWKDPDEGIWEVRGPRRDFTHSKVMAWVAFDRAVAGVEQFGLDGPVDVWRQRREEVHREVCERGWSPVKESFTQSYDAEHLDASLLMMSLVGFLPATDQRMIGTVTAIERELMHKGFVHRYASDETVDGLPAGEGAFLACSFWLADNLHLQGRHDEALALFERLLALQNDVGLLAEEYDPVAGRMVGNFPQAFSHESLVNTAHILSRMSE